jgi:hypothetical protein
VYIQRRCISHKLRQERHIHMSLLTELAMNRDLYQVAVQKEVSTA